MTTKANEINSINKKISEIHFKIIKKQEKECLDS